MVLSLIVLSHIILAVTILIKMTIQVPSGRNLQEQLIEPLNLQVKGISIMHSVITAQAKESILFILTIQAQTLWKTKMEFSIYKVESDANYLYLYSYELNTPVKISIQGNSLYTMNGDRYEIWR